MEYQSSSWWVKILLLLYLLFGWALLWLSICCVLQSCKHFLGGKSNNISNCSVPLLVLQIHAHNLWYSCVWLYWFSWSCSCFFGNIIIVCCGMYKIQRWLNLICGHRLLLPKLHPVTKIVEYMLVEGHECFLPWEDTFREPYWIIASLKLLYMVIMLILAMRKKPFCWSR